MNKRSIFTVFVALTLVALAFVVVQSSPTTAQQDEPATRDSVSVTVYNQGTALIKDRRTFNFTAGENLINFTDVAATIDSTSVSFKSLDNPDTYVIEQNYVYDLVDSTALLERYLDETITLTMFDEGGTVYTGQLLSGRDGQIILRQENGEVTVLSAYSARDIRFPNLPDGLITRPTLRWLVSSPLDGDQQVELTYLAGGMSWTADYNVLLAAENTSLDLNGWVTLNNTSGAGYADAQLKLVAGDVNRVMDEYALGGADYDMENRRDGDNTGVTQRDLFEYKLYEVERPVTIGNNETKQVEFVSGGGVPANIFYVYNGSYPFYGYGSPIRDQYYGNTGVTTVSSYLEFSTGEENGVGADLPAGRIRVYQEDIDGSALLIGENTIQHTPEGEDIQIYLGNAFDLVGEHTQTNFDFISRRVLQETYEIRLRNHKEDETVEIRVPEQMWRWSEWEIMNASAEYTKTSSSSIEFRVEVPPQGETVITYTVQYSFP